MILSHLIFQLSSLYEIKPPISKAKMTSITKSAIKAIKFYKHVVQSVEKFIQKCRPEYKIPGLYVIDSIVRQSRHQFGPDKDVFAPRFAKNVQFTFHHLYKCNEDEKSRVIRVLNLWQKNEVFASELIQPLFDLANPNSEISKQMEQAAPAPPPASGPPSSGSHAGPSGGQNATISVGGGASSASSGVKDSTAVLAGLASGALPGTSPVDQQVTQQLQTILQLLKNHVQPQEQPQQGTVQFNKQLLDFDYSDDEEGGGAHDSHDHPPPPQMLEALQSILGNGALLEKLKSIGAIGESQIQQLRQLLPQVQQQQQQPTHLMGAFSGGAGSLVGNVGATAAENNASLQPALWSQDKFGMSMSGNVNHHRNNIGHHGSGRSPPEEGERDETDEDIQIVEDRTSNWRRNANVLRRSRSRSRDRKRSRRSRSRSRDRSNNGRRRRSRSKDRIRDRSNREEDRDKRREREKRGLPPIKKGFLSGALDSSMHECWPASTTSAC